MKKTLLSLSIAGLMASSANAVNVFNNDGTSLDVSGSARVVLAKKTTERVDLQNDGSRIKFKFSQRLTDSLQALGFMELRPSGENFDGGITTKYLYAGLQFDGFGSLTFGRQKTASDGFKLADPAEQDLAIDDAMGMQTSSQKNITLKLPQVYGLQGFALETSYLFDHSADKKDENGNGIQVLAKYQQNIAGFGVKIHALYAHQKNNGIHFKSTQINEQTTQETFGFAGAVNMGDFGLAIDYASTELKGNKANQARGLVISGIPTNSIHKARGMQTALTYQVTEPVDVYALYRHYTYQPKEAGKYIVNGFTLGSHYFMNKNVMTYVELSRDNLSDHQTVKGFHDNAGFVGLRVFF